MKTQAASRRVLGSLQYIRNHPLARRNLFAAYYRYFRFHLRYLFTSELHIYKFPGDIQFYAKQGMGGIVDNIYTGLADYEEMSFLLHFLNPVDYFIDIGANVGSYSLLAAGICKSHVTAFEPIPETYHLLCKNIQLNRLECFVTPIQKGLGSEQGKLRFLRSMDALNRVLSSNEQARESDIVFVDVLPLDQFNLTTIPILLKIDVEGYESPILKGAKNTLSNSGCKAIIIELNGSGRHYGISDLDTHHLLIDYEFLPYKYSPENRELTRINHKNLQGFNTIYIRDIQFVQNRVQTAQSFCVLNTWI